MNRLKQIDSANIPGRMQVLEDVLHKLEERLNSGSISLGGAAVVIGRVRNEMQLLHYNLHCTPVKIGDVEI